ncbi:MAG TPA: protein kinase [Pyrinomonadaceae bacterium]|nr:protein kinase [Pyrinomonadaceae bacterium]
MSPERWQKIKAVLEETLNRLPEERAEFLARTCRGDVELRSEVESLLAFEEQEKDFIEEPAFAASTRTLPPRTPSLIGQRIGNFKILSELGSGGMGAVYLAERADGKFNQKVAIKVVKRGMDSDAILRRFHTERQILASLEHPFIARMLDGGTTDDGLPYFVMEYVEGKPITEYAEEHDLPLPDRLDLFREVCSAVQYAHRNLVVHRDLKPSNILVTKDGMPKLLDFGIAKLLKANAANETATQTFIFTPEYASPEQVRGEKLTTASDTYSLGVILYELLTGHRPYKTAEQSLNDILRMVCETKPARPSSVIRGKTTNQHGLRATGNGHKTSLQGAIRNPKSLRGDLDNIILKALNKEPERRYSSVEKFAEDIRRHLRGLPVTARADVWSYRANKFVKRNRFAVGGGLLIILTLLGGVVATLEQARIARREKAKAERRFNDVRHLANSFMFEINDEIQRSPVKARELLVKRAVEYLDGLAEEAHNDASLQRELATAYQKIGDIQSGLYVSNTGNSAGALQSYSKSLAMFEALFERDKNNPEAGLELTAALTKMGEIHNKTGDIARSIEYHRRAVGLNESLVRIAPENSEVENSLARAYSRLGHAVLRTGNLPEVLEHYRQSQNFYEKLVNENPADLKAQMSLGVILNYTGYVLSEMGDAAGALENNRRALFVVERVFNAGEQSERDYRNLSLMHFGLGTSLRETGDTEGALRHHSQALEMAGKLWEADPDNINNRNTLADCFLENANSLAQAGKFDEAQKHYLKAIEHYEIVRRGDEKNINVRRQIFYTKRHQANALAANEKNAEALRLYEQALAGFRELTSVDPNNDEWQHDLAVCALKMGEALMKKGDYVAARENIENSTRILENLVARSPAYARRKRDLESARNFSQNLLESRAAKR